MRWVALALGGLVACAAAPPTAERLLQTPEWQEMAGGTGCEERRLESPRGPVLAMYIDGRLARIDVIESGVATEGGIGIGDTAATVRERYGDALVETPHKYTAEQGGQYLTVAAGDNRKIVFETDGSRVTSYRIGRVPEVEWVEGCA